MRLPVLSSLLILGLSAIVVAAPHQNGFPLFHNTTCVAVPTTVYVTIPGSVSTIYITHPAGSSDLQIQPTTTITSMATSQSTRTLTISLSLESLSLSATAKGVDIPSYGYTVIENVVYTVTELYDAPTATNTPVAHGPSSSDEVYQFYVDNSTTVWVGATPSTVKTDAVIITSVVTIIPVDTSISDIHLTRTSTRRISTTVRSTSIATATETLLSSTFSHIPTSNSQTTGLVFTIIASGGWNSTSMSRFIYNAVTSHTEIKIAHSSRIKQSTFATDIPSIDIYGLHPTISVSSYAAASGFQTNSPGSTANSTSIIMPTRSSFGAALNSTATTHHYSFSVSTGLTTASLTSVVSRTFYPPFANSTSRSFSLTSSAQGTEGVPSLPTSSLTVTPSYPVISSSSVILLFSNFTLQHLSTMSSTQGEGSSSCTSGPPSPPAPSDTAVITNSLPSTTPELFPLGAACSSTLQCANGAECYATNAMLITVCGNFQASCSSDKQCAFNACNEGFCNGPKPRPSSTYLPSGIQISNSTLSSPSFTASSTISAASCVPRGPGYGNFTLNFDDIPPLVPDTDNGSVHAAPLFNPYHQFRFSDGFTVNPPPKDAFNPSSPPLLLEFTPFYSLPHAGPPDAQPHFTGQISSGDRASTGCFNFNFYGGSFGCNSTGPDCNFSFSGYRYDTIEQRERVISTQPVSLPACPAQIDCTLVPIFLDNSFKNLTHVRINATVEGEPKSWWVDDLNLGWFDNSCRAGKCRLKSHIRR